jgi:hypothetical protein
MRMQELQLRQTCCSSMVRSCAHARGLTACGVGGFICVVALPLIGGIVLTIVQSQISCEEHPPALTGTDFVRNKTPPRALPITSLPPENFESVSRKILASSSLTAEPPVQDPSAGAPHIGPVTFGNGRPGALCSLTASELHVALV